MLPLLPVRIRSLVTATALAVAAGGASAGPVGAANVEETFDTPPETRGWTVWGDGAPFAWDPVGQRLEVDWDSSRPNGFFALPLPSPLTASHDFGFAFDLTLGSHAVGVLPGQPGTFQIAAGLIRRADVLATNYSRGAFPGPRNTVEWTWFGEAGAVSASVSPVIIPSDGRLPWGYADSFVTLEPGRRHRFELRYTATDRTARLRMGVDGQAGPLLQDVVLPAGFTRFEVDAFAICNYSGAGQHPLYAGSVRAHGWIDHISVTVPGPAVPALRLRARDGGVAFDALAGGRYQLEASRDLAGWTAVAEIRADRSGELELRDPREGPRETQFYRVVAHLP